MCIRDRGSPTVGPARWDGRCWPLSARRDGVPVWRLLPCLSPLSIGWTAIGRRFGNQVSDQRGPTGLVTCAQPSSGVAVEVLVKEDVVSPVWIGLGDFIVAVDRAATMLISQEHRDQAAGKIVRYLAVSYTHLRAH